MQKVLSAVGEALAMAGSMGWEILWALILGFFLSGAVEAVVRKETVSRWILATTGPQVLAVATGLGAASVSCSYAAVALARSLFRKGANFTPAMAFEIASTNLVIEMGIILALLMGWQFTLAEFVGGPLMILILAVLFRLFLRRRILEAAREQADKGLAGRMEGHAAMDMGVHEGGNALRRLASPPGFTADQPLLRHELGQRLRRHPAGGLLIAGAFAAWIPTSWLHAGLPRRQSHRGRNPAVRWSARCSPWSRSCARSGTSRSRPCCGTAASASAAWCRSSSPTSSSSPCCFIYRKYYGTRMALFLFGTFYVAMAGAGYIIEIVFGALGLIPTERNAQVIEAADLLELHHLAQHRVPAAGRRPRGPVRPHRRRPRCSG